MGNEALVVVGVIGVAVLIALVAFAMLLLKTLKAPQPQRNPTIAPEREVELLNRAKAAEGKAHDLELSNADLRHELDAAQREAAAAQREQQLSFEKELSAKQSTIDNMENDYKVQMGELERAKDRTIEDLEARLSEARENKMRLSVKLLGESLEQHCENSFNQLRATAFRDAEFGKDNEVVEGTKGDYIYRETDEDGVEIISIMFEMKNEAEDSVNKHTNDSFLKKLDRDRAKKHCEYAVLVSMLEPDSDYYNSGIVDVSYRYPKMYVIRPQFFIPMITLLRNAALDSMEARRQLSAMLQSQPDVTGFEDKLDKLKGEVARANDNAQGRCEAAVKEIDATIKKLEKIREDIEKIGKYSDRANQRMDDITIRRLTHGNPNMREKFAQAREAAPAAAEVLAVESVEAEE